MAYKCLEDEAFQHLNLNNNFLFVDPDTGDHTNAIEEDLVPDKKKDTPKKHDKNHSDSYQAEYICGEGSIIMYRYW